MSKLMYIFVYAYFMHLDIKEYIIYLYVFYYTKGCNYNIHINITRLKRIK